MKINPYLTFDGNAEEAFNFYKSIFGGKFLALQRFGEMPGGEKMPASDREKILHVALPIGQANILMASDALGTMGQNLTAGNNFSLSIDAKSKEEADRLFNGLSKGGQITMPLGDAFWGAYFGMLTDRFGVQWMVNYDYNRNKQINYYEQEKNNDYLLDFNRIVCGVYAARFDSRRD